MMNIVWAGMCFVGLAWGLAQGRGAALTEGALTAVMDAVSLSIRLAGGFALWNGMLAILEKSGALRALTRALSPVLRCLFRGVPADSPAQEAMAMNMAANMLGLGNAATPMGLRAMRLLPREADAARASDAMCMFLVVNASSIQLFPSSVIALRAAAGSAEPASIVLPSLLATTVSTAVGIAACKALERWGRRRGE